uniref:LanC-like protein 2 n=1 Tax=Sinocyclocheilus rhinocerous TaxID=307959 RepID=A0A673LUM7_9TELE
MGENMSKRLKLVTGSESEMEERSFINPFPDREPREQGLSGSPSAAEHSGANEPLDAGGKVCDLAFKKGKNAIKTFLKSVNSLQKYIHINPNIDMFLPVNTLLYLQLYRVTQEASHLQRALDYVKRALRNLNGRRVSFLCGDAGPLAVGAVVHHHLKNQTESQDRLIALNMLRSSLKGHLAQITCKIVVTAVLESGKNLSKEEKKAERCPLLYEWHKKQYVGAAHGLAGIYYMLMQPSAKVSQDTLNELVRPSVDYVRHKKFRSGNYPSSLSNETDRLVHWCHGAPGVLHMLIMTHKVFKDEKYLRDAAECGEVIWQRGLLRKGYGLCHGTAGNGYALLSLYHATQDKKYLYRACKFAEWCLDYGTHGCRIPDRPYSLFEGMAGAIHYLSDVIQPEGSCFPAFEL